MSFVIGNALFKQVISSSLEYTGSHAPGTCLPIVKLFLRFLKDIHEAYRHKHRFSLKFFWQRSRYGSTWDTTMATRQLRGEKIPWLVLPAKRNKKVSFSVSRMLNLEIFYERTLLSWLEVSLNRHRQGYHSRTHQLYYSEDSQLYTTSNFQRMASLILFLVINPLLFSCSLQLH